jgi:hypothetical protein
MEAASTTISNYSNMDNNGTSKPVVFLPRPPSCSPSVLGKLPAAPRGMYYIYWVRPTDRAPAMSCETPPYRHRTLGVPVVPTCCQVHRMQGRGFCELGEALKYIRELGVGDLSRYYVSYSQDPDYYYSQKLGYTAWQVYEGVPVVLPPLTQQVKKA